MSDKNKIEEMRDKLALEKDQIVQGISNLEQSLAQHRQVLERTDGALFVMNKMLADIEEGASRAEEEALKARVLNGSGKRKTKEAGLNA